MFYYNSSPIVDYYSGITINHNYYTPDDIYKNLQEKFEGNNVDIVNEADDDIDDDDDDIVKKKKSKKKKN